VQTGHLTGLGLHSSDQGSYFCTQCVRSHSDAAEQPSMRVLSRSKNASTLCCVSYGCAGDAARASLVIDLSGSDHVGGQCG
jgi:hypothetical protein